ncbi:hypothetical protein ACFVGN_34655, partial [Streptomyces sp. NPDC057757]|uniref:hypothetical protein n=1 Tax=Streptomyces sp. NPDC057757 TaxID=3346241 RepID=UPI0036AC3FAC
SLDIAGDIDVRLDATLTNWTDAVGGLDTVELFGKLNLAGGTKSWVLATRADRLYFEWSADGAATFSASSTVLLPVTASGRMAVRVTLDVDNGASGRTIRFYTAPSGTAGLWTQLGAPVVQAGTTSIFNSATLVKVGDATDVNFTRPVGRVHKAEIRNGIGGTIVANPDFGAQAVGATSFVDGAGRTWSVNGTSTITNRRTRLTHELAAYPTEWHPSGRHAWVAATTAGILRRLRRGDHALDSTLRRRIPSGSPLAYWPMEDGANSTQFASPILRVRPMSTKGMDMASADSLAGSRALPVVRAGALYSGTVPKGFGPPATQWQGEFVFNLPNAGPATARTVLQWTSTGTVKRWRLMLRTGVAEVYGHDVNDGVVISWIVAPLPQIFNAWCRWQLYVVQNGGNVDVTVAWIPIGGQGAAVGGSYAGTTGRLTGFSGNTGGAHGDLEGLALGHIAALPTANTTIYNNADIAFTGEAAGARMQRLATEEALPLTVCGAVAEQTPVGPQRPEGVLDLLEEAAESDGGILYEDREVTRLRYRGRATMYNQTPALILDYTAPGLATPLQPTGDDDATKNDVTVERVGGSSARAVLEEGALSVLAPPNGVGIGYDTSIPLSLHSDDQTEPIAYWRLHQGTYEGRRYPQVRVMVHRAPGLMDQILAVDVGDKIVIKNPPRWVAPGDVELIVQGYEEEFSSDFEWDITFNCTPGRPWTVGVADDTVLGIADTDGSQLATAVTSSATTFPVQVTDGREWLWETAFPAGVGGEEMTVNAIAPWLSDALGRTVANGWGTADSGQVWSTGGGVAADFAVGSGYGSHTLSTVNLSRRTFVTAPWVDFDMYADLTTSAVATGASLAGGPTGRYLDSDNLYQAQLAFTTANALVLTLRKRVAAVETQLTTITLPTPYILGTYWRVRFRATGSLLQAKAWPTGTPEPGWWHASATDGSITTASLLGVRSISSAGNTNVGAQIRYDAVRLTNPQQFTVARGANGITKAHAIGAPLSLARPAPVAL